MKKSRNVWQRARALALEVFALYCLYAAVMVWLHPRFIYPFSDQPFVHESYQRHELGPDGPSVYAYDAGEGAPVVLYFMGNVGALTPFVPMLDHHRAAGRSVVAMGYRGGGGLPGTPSESALKADALAAFDALPQLISAPGEIFSQGFSLGTGLAMHVAAQRKVDAVILAAPYAKMCRLMAARAYLPACLLPGVQKWDSTVNARKVEGWQVLILHGTEDALIPIAEGERLRYSFDPSTGFAHFAQIEGAQHSNLFSFPDYRDGIDAFIEDAPDCPIVGFSHWRTDPKPSCRTP